MLTQNAYELLKIFYAKKALTNTELEKVDSNAFDMLLSKKYIENKFLEYKDNGYAQYSDYYITELGKAYIQSHSKLRWWKNNWISFLGMIFAFISALPVILQIIAYILKNIM